MSKQDAFPVGLASRGSHGQAPSISPVVMPMDGRPRCERHGMLTLSGTQCSRCLKEDSSRNTRRTLFIVSVIAMGVLLTLVGARAFMIGRELAAASSASFREPAPSGEARLVVYTTSSCPYCKKAKAWLDEQQIAYVEKSVDSDETAQDEWRKLGGRTVPMFAIDGDVVQRGYDASGKNLTRILEERGLR